MSAQDISATVDAPAPVLVDTRSPVARCVVVLPSAHEQYWRRQILSRAIRAGLEVIDYHGGPLPAVEGEDRRVVLTHAAQLVDQLAPRALTVIMTGLASATDHVARLYALEPAQGVWSASQLLADGSRLLGANFVTDQNLTAGQRRVDLAPDLAIMAPEFPPYVGGSEIGSAAEKAFALYRKGPPAIGAKADWPLSLFSYDQREVDKRPDVATLDVCGRPRILVFGPYISLPPGTWRATIRFSVDDSACRHRYRLEWGDQTAFTTHFFTPVKAGVFEAVIDYTWSHATHSEVRLVLTEGSLGGTLAFLGLSVERIA